MVDEYPWPRSACSDWYRSDSSMVDEYTYFNERRNIVKVRSDSSMVDEYTSRADLLWSLCSVQIPLWSMNTLRKLIEAKQQECSDSSMVDEYFMGTSLRPRRKSGSDSSMVDEYEVLHTCPNCMNQFRFLYGRWIHHIEMLVLLPKLCSDSSMVDEYDSCRPCRMGRVAFRFLYGRWIRWNCTGN